LFVLCFSLVEMVPLLEAYWQSFTETIPEIWDGFSHYSVYNREGKL